MLPTTSDAQENTLSYKSCGNVGGRRVLAPENQPGGSFLVQLHNMASRMRIDEDE